MPTNTYVALQTQVLSSNAATVTFTSIPQGYTDLLLVAVPIATSNGQASYIRVGNGSIDSGSNYSMTAMGGTGSAASSIRRTNATEYSVEYLPAADTTAKDIIMVHFMNYSNTTTFKTFLSRSGNASYGTDATVGLWRNTAAINQIAITSGAYAAGSTFSLYGIQAQGVSPAAKATGGAIYSDDLYYYHVFGSTGTFTPLSSLTADVLVVAGGGGGGYNRAGGGGAGGVTYYSSQSLTATGYTCTVGAGGAGSTVGSSKGVSGGNSSFTGLTASVGGGGGGSQTSQTGASGGSGGGGGWDNSGTGGSATSGQGFAGGNAGTDSSTWRAAGGGGGASAIGSNATSASGGTGGAGGAGTNTYSSWLTATGLGVSGFIAGGGGGGGTGPGGAGGSGGGGAGGNTASNINPVAGTANTGGGGGGDQQGANGASGGSGVVIVRYLKA